MTNKEAFELCKGLNCPHCKDPIYPELNHDIDSEFDGIRSTSTDTSLECLDFNKQCNNYLRNDSLSKELIRQELEKIALME